GLHPARPTLGERLFDDIEVCYPALIAVGWNSGGDIRQLLGRVIELERIILVTQEAAAGRPRSRQNGNMARNFSSPHRKLVANDRTEGGMDDGRLGPITGLDGVTPALVISFLADHGADEGNIGHLLSQAF